MLSTFAPDGANEANEVGSPCHVIPNCTPPSASQARPDLAASLLVRGPRNCNVVAMVTTRDADKEWARELSAKIQEADTLCSVAYAGAVVEKVTGALPFWCGRGFWWGL